MRTKSRIIPWHKRTHWVTESRAEDQAQTTYSLYFVSIKIRSACCSKCLAYFSIFSLVQHIEQTKNVYHLTLVLRIISKRKCIIFTSLFSETNAIPHVIIVREMENDTPVVIHIIITHRKMYTFSLLNYKTANVMPRFKKRDRDAKSMLLRNDDADNGDSNDGFSCVCFISEKKCLPRAITLQNINTESEAVKWQTKVKTLIWIIKTGKRKPK